MQKTSYSAALVIIGNEILSGRTQDRNTSWLAEKLSERGISLREVRIIPDIEEVIVNTVNALRAQETYVFTTGGIGPTHDDITAASIAKAFGVDLELNERALQALIDHYGDPAEVTDARKKMAMIPDGASLIDNPVSGAPGFLIGNVYVMAGVPRIMQGMFDGFVHTLAEGVPIISQSITCSLQESQISEGLASIQGRFADVDIGSYPNFRGGEAGVSIVVRSIDVASVKAAGKEVINLMQSLGVEPSAVTHLD